MEAATADSKGKQITRIKHKISSGQWDFSHKGPVRPVWFLECLWQGVVESWVFLVFK